MSVVTRLKRRLRFEKSQLVEFLPGKKKVDFRGSSWPDKFVRYGRRSLVGLRADDVKAVSIEGLCLSLLMSKNLFNSKVIKSFVPELRSRKCLCVSGFLCYLYMSYEHPMYISHIRISGHDRETSFLEFLGM